MFSKTSFIINEQQIVIVSGTIFIQVINVANSSVRQPNIVNVGFLFVCLVKGACKNCGSMTHTEKDCFYPPRKRGAWKTNKDIKPDEYINPELNLSYEGKRDRWNG